MNTATTADDCAPSFSKVPSGVSGLDAITDGGLPRGRATLVCGGVGCGKTLFALQFLANGIRLAGEPGVFMSFEERIPDLLANTGSLDFDLASLVNKRQLHIEEVDTASVHTAVSGSFNLDGLLLRLEAAIDATGAKRVVLDTVDRLFATLADSRQVRVEFHRLLLWLKQKNVTAVVTSEKNSPRTSRHSLEEYVADCVISLDQRIRGTTHARWLRIIKYRGSIHSSAECPFVIDRQGLAVLPMDDIDLSHDASSHFVSSGVEELDDMLGGKGYHAGSTILISGTAGTGKSSLAAQFADAACARGERCLYCAQEESPQQIMRNMRSIGIDLERWQQNGLLRFLASRPLSHALHVQMRQFGEAIAAFSPRIVVIDPVSSLDSVAENSEVSNMAIQLISKLKANQVTTLLTSLVEGGQAVETSGIAVSSLVDSWLLVRSMEVAGERTRGLYIIKSRGMNHSRQVRELVLSAKGVDLEEVSVDPNGKILVGSARAAQRMRDEADALTAEKRLRIMRTKLRNRERALEARIEELRAEHLAEAQDIQESIEEESWRYESLQKMRLDMAAQRQNLEPEPPDRASPE